MIAIAQGKLAMLRPPPANPYTTMGWRLTWSYRNTRTGSVECGSLLVVDGEEGFEMPSTSIQDGKELITGPPPK